MTNGMGYKQGQLLRVKSDIDFLPETVIKGGETVRVEHVDDWQIYLRPTRTHKRLRDDTFTVDCWDETTLRKLEAV